MLYALPGERLGGCLWPLILQRPLVPPTAIHGLPRRALQENRLHSTCRVKINVAMIQ